MIYAGTLVTPSELYGSGLYGGSSPATSAAVAKAVGTKYDLAINGVGLRLAPGQKAYNKNAAPTFGYNIKNQLSSTTRLAARDLFFWIRYEHNDWTDGETLVFADPGVNDSNFSASTGYDVTQPGKLTHLKAPVESKTLVAAASYGNFVEDISGNLWVNEKNTRMWYTSDGGASWTSVTLPGADTGDIAAVWSSGANIFCATPTNIYKGTTASFAAFPTSAIANCTAGTYYNGAHYVGYGTKMAYIDNAGVKTDEFDTVTHNVTVIIGYQGKVYFGGVRGNNSRLWTWTWTGAPPTPSNGSGAEIQQGTLPAGFVITSVTVYLNLLELGGYFPGAGGAVEGIGAVYYINGTIFGQLLQLGSTQTGRSYAIRSLFGYNNFLLVGYNHKTGIGVYDFGHGAFSSGTGTQSYVDSANNEVLAVCVHKNRYYFLVKNDGVVWRSGDSPVATATLNSLEFAQLGFINKLIDGHELAHSALRTNEKIELSLSFDSGATWTLSGQSSVPNAVGANIPLKATKGQHWRSRITSYVGSDTTKSPEVYHWSERFSPQPTRSHLWTVQALLTRGFFKDNSPQQDPSDKVIDQLWAAQAIQGTIEFIDMDRKVYNVVLLDAHEIRIDEQARKQHKLPTHAAIYEMEFLEAGI